MMFVDVKMQIFKFSSRLAFGLYSTRFVNTESEDEEVLKGHKNVEPNNVKSFIKDDKNLNQISSVKS